MAAQVAIILQQILNLSSLSDSGSRGRGVFEWGASISALLLLVVNQSGRRSGLQASLLVLSLLISFPTVLFKILREQFGYWVAFLLAVSNFVFPQKIPVSRFLLFVVAPDWPIYELGRDSISGGIFCLFFTILIVATELHGVGESGRFQCSLHTVGYWSSLFLFLFFIILYLCLGPW